MTIATFLKMRGWRRSQPAATKYLSNLGGARLLTSRPLRTAATAREDARPTNEFFI